MYFDDDVIKNIVQATSHLFYANFLVVFMENEFFIRLS